MTPCCLLFSNQLVESLSQHQSVATLVLDRAENITDATLVEFGGTKILFGLLATSRQSPCVWPRYPAPLHPFLLQEGRGGSLEEDGPNSEDQDHATSLRELVVPLAAGWSVILPSAGRYDPACLSHWGLFHNHVSAMCLLQEELHYPPQDCSTGELCQRQIDGKPKVRVMAGPRSSQPINKAAMCCDIDHCCRDPAAVPQGGASAGRVFHLRRRHKLHQRRGHGLPHALMLLEGLTEKHALMLLEGLTEKHALMLLEGLNEKHPLMLLERKREIATLTHKFSSVTLFRNKTVRYAARMHAIIACQMEFQLYPMDIQVCPMYIESFSYNHQKLQLHWSKDGVTVNPELKLLQYNMGQPLKLEETTGYMQEKEGTVLPTIELQVTCRRREVQYYQPWNYRLHAGEGRRRKVQYYQPWNYRLHAGEGRYSTTNHGTTGYMQEKEGTVLPTMELQVTCRRREVQYYQPWNYRLHAGEGRAIKLSIMAVRRQHTASSPLCLVDVRTASWFRRIHSNLPTVLTIAANFSRLIMYFRFERQIGHHLIQTFAPSSLVVMLSWFSFWLGLDAIPGRVTLLVTSMLTLVTMFTGLKTDIPPVAYVKALDLWMAGCMVFVFAALGEFVVVKVLDVRYQLDKETRVATLPRILPMRIHALDKPHCMTAWDVEGVRCRKPSLSFRNRGLVKLAWVDRATGQEKILWQEIDRQSRVMFPVLFLVFVVFYWPILLLKKS
uniref:Uncharacterized protein n=1 Tax=Timema bartmani TaxID=61472 RepID=A0A7R9EV74_9NEOP|nr:unnamed protein product [Timema bartmani]